MSLTKVTWSMTETGVSCIEDFGASPSASASENAIAIAAALTAVAASKNILTTRSIGVFEVTGTFIIPAGVQFVGRTYGDKPTLRWSGATAPTNLPTMSAFVLAGNQSALVGWNVNMETSGDFRRTVSMGGFNNQVCTNNKITLNLTGVSLAASHFTIFCAANSLFYNTKINDNEITGSVNAVVDGVQMSLSVNAQVMRNYFHDISTGVLTNVARFNWGIYCSQRCYGALVSGNTIENTNLSGIRVANIVDGVANDYGRRVTDNHIKNVTWVGLSLDELNGAVASGNIIDTTGYPVGILECESLVFSDTTIKNFVTPVTPISATLAMVEITTPSKNITMSNLSFDDANDALYCIFADCDGVNISNIAVSGTAPHAIIQTTSTTNNVTISNVNASESPIGSTGSRIFLGNDGTTVNNCRIICTVGASQQAIRVTGDRNIVSNNRVGGGNITIWLTSTSTNSIANGNIVSGASGTPILDDGTGNSVVNNIIV